MPSSSVLAVSQPIFINPCKIDVQMEKRNYNYRIVLAMNTRGFSLHHWCWSVVNATHIFRHFTRAVFQACFVLGFCILGTPFWFSKRA